MSTPQRTMHDRAVTWDAEDGAGPCPDCGACTYHDGCDGWRDMPCCETCGACQQCIAECAEWRREDETP